jgi:aspartyl-tRNA(Asn)/glutamyl-tRNA(Gln) amidotransferase subunit A
MYQTRITGTSTLSDWHRLGIRELHEAFAEGRARPTLVIDHLLARIDVLNPALRAFIEVDRQGALHAAEESDTRLKLGTMRPLEGIPVAVKANIAVKGLEHNAGMDARSGMIAEEDAAVVALLRDAGAIILGTLNMHEAALGATTDNPFFGQCLNPHGEGMTPGGSSGGSAVAVAAGLCVAAIGTDTLGSIRIPASYCGVYGLKTSRDMISDAGVVPLSRRFDAIGPIARSLEDLDAVSKQLFSPSRVVAMRQARFLTLDALGGVPCEPAVEAAYEAALAALPGTPDRLTLTANCERIRTGTFIAATRELILHLVELGAERCERFSEEIETLIDIAIARSDSDYEEDGKIVREAAVEILGTIEGNGVLILPTTPQVAFRAGERAPRTQADFTVLANVAGLPSISIPAGRDENGLPIGVQLIGPPAGEAMLLSQARRIDEALRAFVAPPCMKT